MNGNESKSELLWAMIATAVIVAWFFVLLFLATNVGADGGGSDDSYKIGVDTTVNPAEYRRLYLPIYTAGNNTHVTFQVDVERSGGQDNDRFWVELLDNENMMLSLSYITSYEVYTAGSSTRAVETYGIDLVLSRSQGWDEGVYWIIVEKDAPGNTWCWISYEYSYETDAPGMGGLVEKEISRVDNRIDDLEFAHKGLVSEVEALGIQLGKLFDLVEELQEINAKLAENDSLIRGLISENAWALYRLKNELEAMNDSVQAALEDLNISVYMQLRAVQDDLNTRVAMLNADLNYTMGRQNTIVDKVNGIKDNTDALEERVDELEALLDATEANVTALEGEEMPADSDAGAYAVGLIALGVAGTAAAMGRRGTKSS